MGTMVERRWLRLAVLTTGLVAGAVVARRRPFSTRLAWLLTLPGVQAMGRAEELAALLGVRSGMRVLDAGAGPGRVALPLAERVGPEGMVTVADMQLREQEVDVRQAAGGCSASCRFQHAELGRGVRSRLRSPLSITARCSSPCSAGRRIGERRCPSGQLPSVPADDWRTSGTAVVRTLSRNSGDKSWQRVRGGNWRPSGDPFGDSPRSGKYRSNR